MHPNQAIALLRQKLRRQRRDVSVALDVAEVTEAVTEAVTGAAARGRGVDAGAERAAAKGGAAGAEGDGRSVERRTCIVNRCGGFAGENYSAWGLVAAV